MHQRTHHCDDKERKMNPKLPHETFSNLLVLLIFCFMQIHAQRNPTNQCKVGFDLLISIWWVEKYSSGEESFTTVDG